MTGVGASSPSSSPSSSSLFSLPYLLLLRSNLPVQFTPTSRIHPFHPSVLSQPMGRGYAMTCTVVGRTCLLTAWICVIFGCCRLVCGDCGVCVCVCVWTPLTHADSAAGTGDDDEMRIDPDSEDWHRQMNLLKSKGQQAHHSSSDRIAACIAHSVRA